MSGAQQQMKLQNKKFTAGGKQGKKEEKAPVSALVLSIFLFVVVGSALISLFKVM